MFFKAFADQTEQEIEEKSWDNRGKVMLIKVSSVDRVKVKLTCWHEN